MKMKFWRRNTDKHLSAPPEEKARERGYFDSVRNTGMQDHISNDDYKYDVGGPDNAMRLATVYRCVSILSGSIASLPLQLLRKRNGVFMPDEADPLNYLLTLCPNNSQTAFELIKNTIITMVIQGNAYIYPEWRGGEVDALVLLSVGSVSYDKLLNTYIVNDPINNIYKTLESDEIIHLRNISLDGGYTGVSTIRYAAMTMRITASANSQSAQNFRPGNTYKGFISGDADNQTRGYVQYEESQLQDAATRFREELQSGETITYLPGQLKFNALSMSPADIQLMEMMKFSVLDLCRFFGVHPDMAFAGQSQNYKASEMSQVQFMTGTLQPILRQIENEFFAKLIPRSVAGKYRIRFDIESFYQTDLETLSTYYEKQVQNGLSTVNELRARFGKAPVDGGDTAMISCNVAPINSTKIRGEEINKNNGDKVPPTNGENDVL